MNLQNNGFADETVILQQNAVEEESPTLQSNQVAAENPTVQDNETVVERDDVPPLSYAEEDSVAPATYTDAQSVEAADYTDDTPTVQGNTVVTEDSSTEAVNPEEDGEPIDATPRTDIDGSLAVSKDITVGGHARVGDDALFKRNVTVEGWLEADNLKGKIKDRLDEIEEIAADAVEGAITVQILTDRGNVIHNGEGQRTLTAYVFRRNEDITAQIAQSYFSWERTSADTTGDRIWSRLHKGIGNVCTVTEQDIARSALFTCVVDLEQLNNIN